MGSEGGSHRTAAGTTATQAAAGAHEAAAAGGGGGGKNIIRNREAFMRVNLGGSVLTAEASGVRVTRQRSELR